MSVALNMTWVVRFDYHDGNGVETAYFSSGVGWRTGPTDTPANTEIQPRVIRPPEYFRSIFGDRRTVGRSEIGIGDIALANGDGAFTDWVSHGYGRVVEVYVGDEGTAFPNDWTLFMRGIVHRASLRTNEFILELRDLKQELRKIIQTNTYAGDNVAPDGFEGTPDDLRGQPKPLLYGLCYQVPCILVNSSKHLYQVHDGPVEAILACRDMGAQFGFDQDFATKELLAAHEVTEGQYATCLAEGFIKLSAKPAGTVTADVQGDASGSGYVSSAARIVERILLDKAEYDTSDLDTASFTALHNDAPASTGTFIQTERYIDEVVDQLLAGVGGYVVPDRLGKWQAGRFEAPSGSSVATVTDDDILTGEWLPQSDYSEGLPIYRVSAKYQRVWHLLNDSDIAGVVAEYQRAWMTKDFRESVGMDINILVKYPNAKEVSFETLLNDADDIDDEVSRELTMRKVYRDFLRLTVSIDRNVYGSVDLGDVVTIDSQYFLGSAAPKDMRVTGISAQGKRGRYTLTLWG